MNKLDFNIFPGKDLSGLFQDIYKNQQTKKRRISELIFEIKNVVRKTGAGQDSNDVAILYPIIRDLVDSSVKNDDSLIKMAVIVQRMIAAEGKQEADGGVLSDSEKKQLLKDFKELTDGEYDVDKDISEIEKQLEKTKEEIGIDAEDE